MKFINSPSNPTIKLIRGLRQKKKRDETGLFYIEGIRLVGEAIRTYQSMVYAIFCPDILDSEFGNNLIQNIKDHGVQLISVPIDVFNSFAMKEGPQGIAAIIKQKWADMNSITKIKGVWVALESIQDPGNLGTILRSNDAAGGQGIILLEDSTDPYHPTSVRASMGGVFTQIIIKSNYKIFSEWKHEFRYPMIGTSCGDSFNYRRYNYPDDMVLLMGSEQKGITKMYENLCDDLVTIPMRGSVDSLNLSNATSIILFEILAQHS